MLGIGAIVGAGIFAFIGIAVGQHAGPATMLSLIVAGLACICAAFCYAELASALPISGSSYTFTYATMGELPAFLLGGILLLGYCLTAASVASSWSGYMQSFLFDYGIQLPAIFSKHFGHIVTLTDGSTVTAWFDLPALFITVVLLTLVYFGTEVSAIVNTVLVMIKMSVLLTFIIVGITKINPANWHPFIPENTGNFGEFGISGIIAASSIILLAYTGFDVVASAAQETKNPRKNLPIGIIGSLLICMLFYVGVAAVLTGLVPYTELNVIDPLAVAVNRIHIPWFMHLLKIGAILGLASVILSLAYACVRILFTVTHDGLLPKKLAKIHKKHHTPYRITFIVGLVIIFLGAISPVDKLVEAANFGLLSSFVAVCLATMILRHTRPELPREFKCPLVPFVPVAGIVLFVIVFCGLSKMTFMLAAGWILFLLLVYTFYSSKHSMCGHD
jgi:APA family basic amino acid/polyamine antiporter